MGRHSLGRDESRRSSSSSSSSSSRSTAADATTIASTRHALRLVVTSCCRGIVVSVGSAGSRAAVEIARHDSKNITKVSAVASQTVTVAVAATTARPC